MRKGDILKLGLAAGFFTLSALASWPAAAMDTMFAGPRAMGMGGAGYRLHGDFFEYIDLDALSEGISDASELAELINLVSSLEGVTRQGNGVTADADAGGGLGIRVGRFAVGARVFFAGLRPGL